MCCFCSGHGRGVLGGSRPRGGVCVVWGGWGGGCGRGVSLEQHYEEKGAGGVGFIARQQQFWFPPVMTTTIILILSHFVRSDFRGSDRKTGRAQV